MYIDAISRQADLTRAELSAKPPPTTSRVSPLTDDFACARESVRVPSITKAATRDEVPRLSAFDPAAPAMPTTHAAATPAWNGRFRGRMELASPETGQTDTKSGSAWWRLTNLLFALSCPFS